MLAARADGDEARVRRVKDRVLDYADGVRSAAAGSRVVRGQGMRHKDGAGEFDARVFAAEAYSYDLFDLQDSGLVAA